MSEFDFLARPLDIRRVYHFQPISLHQERDPLLNRLMVVSDNGLTDQSMPHLDEAVKEVDGLICNRDSIDCGARVHVQLQGLPQLLCQGLLLPFQPNLQS